MRALHPTRGDTGTAFHSHRRPPSRNLSVLPSHLPARQKPIAIKGVSTCVNLKTSRRTQGIRRSAGHAGLAARPDTHLQHPVVAAHNIRIAVRLSAAVLLANITLSQSAKRIGTRNPACI